MTMKKKELIILTIIPIVVFLLWYICYPETLGMIEANSYFVNTPDYLHHKLSQPGGAGWICGDYISQLFRWREIGALIWALLVAIIQWSVYATAKKLSLRQALLSAMIASSLFAIALLQWMSMTSAIQVVLLFVAMWIYVSINTRRWRYLIALFFLVVWTTLLPSALSTIFFGWCAIIEYAYLKSNEKAIAIPILYMVIALLVPLIWSYTLSFVPSEMRFTFVSYPSTAWAVAVLTICLPIVVVALSLIHIKSEKLTSTFDLIVVVLLALSYCCNKQALTAERHNRLYAEALFEDWDRLAQSISMDEAHGDKVAQHYLLLSYSQLGILPDKIGEMAPTSTDCFYYFNSNDVNEKEFNSLFYAALGLYNESIHQTFERAMESENAMTFRSLRNMIDWALKEGNAQLAEKYMTVLGRSSCHDSWIEKRMALLSFLKKKPILTPDRYPVPVFMGAHSFVTEMGHLINYDSQNKKKIDYLLCGLLIQKDIARFKAIYNATHYDRLRPNIPSCYQYALQCN